MCWGLGQTLFKKMRCKYYECRGGRRKNRKLGAIVAFAANFLVSSAWATADGQLHSWTDRGRRVSRSWRSAFGHLRQNAAAIAESRRLMRRLFPVTFYRLVVT